MKLEDKSLSEIVISIPKASEIFRKYQLDYSCSGRDSLREACKKKGLKLDEMTQALQSCESIKEPHKSSNEITQEVHNNHEGIKNLFPELLALSQKVEQVHGGHDSCPSGLHSLLTKLYSDKLKHLKKEESLIFPIIAQGYGLSVAMPISVMMAEHEGHILQLQEVRKITNNLTPPEGACRTWCALYSGLEKLEAHMMDHIHLENNILFPEATRRSRE